MAGFPRLRDAYDVAIVGGGHAGLQAALKTALLHFSGVLVDRGPKYSRSYYAPKMVNIPGFPDGISGHKLLDLQIAALRPHADRLTYVTPAAAGAARRVDDGFAVDFEWLRLPRTVRAKVLLLAMGVVDRMPEIGGKIDDIWPWANLGLVDFCEVCDGHDMTGRSVGVLGHTAYAGRLALNLTHFAPTAVAVLTHGQPFLDGIPPDERASLRDALADARIEVVETPIAGFEGIRERAFHVRFTDGTLRAFDRGFSGLGWYDLHQELPRSLGATFDEEGFVATDLDGRVLGVDGAPVPGLYAIGDLRTGWNQIPEAWASAERSVLHAYAEYL